jgi:CRISPR-associated endonuclease/helicase Cas3
VADQQYTTLEGESDSLEPIVRKFVFESRRAWKSLKFDQNFIRRLAVLKAMLISADVAGSALVKTEESCDTWIPKALSVRIEADDLRPVISSALKGRPRRPFQSRVASSAKPATIVMAGCGSGKTTAAYMWAQKWARGKKLFFAYPTTGTTSSGFEDYLLAQDHLARALIHGRSWVDLQAMRVSPEDDGLDSSLKLESLTAWGRQVIACTVDTVLGLIQNQKRPLFSFPAIACGAFVFDEIHSYDRRLFGELLTFLRTFPGAPVLLMSASIPPNRLAALTQVLDSRVGHVIKGDTNLEQIKRYRIEERASSDHCWPDVLEVIKSGKRVLWVCNTVGDALDAYHEALSRGIAPELIKVYHSRFLYAHRVERQDQVIKAFKPNADPCLAITTQVCEMSLDISADLLVTALAPLPALVQRLGRLNRYAEQDDPWLCLVYPFEGKPYDEKEQRLQIEDARTAISKLAGQPCDQAGLATFLAAMKTQEDWTESSTWLQGGWESEPLPAREGDNSVTVIREEDLLDIERTIGRESARTWTSQRLVPWTIPILAKGFRWKRRVGPYPLAELGTVPYNKTEGAR